MTLGAGCDDFRLLPLGLAFFIIPRQTQHPIAATIPK